MNREIHSLIQPTARGLFPPSPRQRGHGRHLWQQLGLWLLLCAPQAAPAQVVKLLDYTNTVRYTHADNLDGMGWTNGIFNDATWPAGPGLLAFEDNAGIVPLIRTVLPSPVNLTPPGHAVYFRVRFNYSFDRPALLSVSNYVDDGAVFYLNGVEMRRVRVGAGTVHHLTLASSASTENTVDAFTYLATNLIHGDNVLAVSVHQSAITSGDIVFGSTIWAEIINPIAITSQPEDQVVELNGSAAFSVAVSGNLPGFQWQFMATNGAAFANIANATNATHSLSNITISQAGFYRCIVTNPVNSATRRVATLTVVPDTTPPVILSAVANEATNYILLTFSERLLLSTVTNLNNYRIAELGRTNELAVTNVQLNGSQVRLWTTPSWLGSLSLRDYVLTINNVADFFTNAIAPDTRIGIAFWRPVLPMNAFWNWCEDFDLTGQDWTSPAYNEATNEWYSGGQWIIPDPSWDPVGRAVFYFPVAPLGGYSVSGNTVLTFGRTTYYFRTRFGLPANASSSGVIRLKLLVDDGAIVYLNGGEIFRTNVPAGPLNYGSLAPNQRGQTVTTLQPWDFAVTNLVGETNLLAVALKPASTLPLVEYGICFGAEVSVAAAPVVPPAGLTLFPVPSLDIARAGVDGVVLRWEVPACVLQTKTRVDDEWSDLPGVTSPFTNAVTATRFFRLRCP